MYVILLILFIIIIADEVQKAKKFSKKYEDSLTDEQKYYIGDKCISLYQRKGYSSFELMGTNHRDLNITDIGKFNGYAIAVTNNIYDEYAIAIYNDLGILIGYAPRGNFKLHEYILSEGGKVHAYGFIRINNNRYFSGEVCIESDKSLVTIKNKTNKRIVE